ncbi:MAG: 6,7-dimethyl-8-ribityllumazine synthase [Crocinitomicaceae bacterium]|nr:6,7-dimethyl-8-ribityllumazine synthase [Crocinitomicaceae bacterium]|tara:strand:+ start:898 stop:1398 length:501 start_codon:yes stop_codon:yes gene_type:complete
MATEGKNLSEFDSNELPNGAHYRVGIVVSEWNREFTRAMMEGAKEVLISAGVPENSIIVKWVPGSYELPLGAQIMLESKSLHLDGVVAIGSVIRGETAHFDYVCSAAAQGVKDVNLKTGKPVAFCVLTDDNEDQTRARSGGIHGNKGTEAAVVVLKMIALRSECDQ